MLHKDLKKSNLKCFVWNIFASEKKMMVSLLKVYLKLLNLK